MHNSFNVGFIIRKVSYPFFSVNGWDTEDQRDFIVFIFSVIKEAIMNFRQILLTGATVMLFATGNAWADSRGGHGPSREDHGSSRENHGSSREEKEDRGTHVAPEIDAKAGTSAIALLTGVLLLIGERSRSRRS
jgi:hypothetical protein